MFHQPLKSTALTEDCQQVIAKILIEKGHGWMDDFSKTSKNIKE